MLEMVAALGRSRTMLARALSYRLGRPLGERALRLGGMLTDRFVVPIDYPTSSANRPRYGYGRPPHAALTRILARYDETYRAQLHCFARYERELAAIERQPTTSPEPYWLNDWLSGLDAVSLYGFLRERAPSRYVEIGSGMSTRFARRAIRDGGLTTKLTSIDPKPRLDIDTLCDRVVREALESVDLELFVSLSAGDVV
ncbi:MAG: hypothetical protein M3377_02040, partial [Actinomycetota bacterium]|nr:hypothetical protein [Actinomycetota bacterium]